MRRTPTHVLRALAILLIVAPLATAAKVCGPLIELVKPQSAPAQREVAEIIAKFRADHPDYTLSINKIEFTVSTSYLDILDAKHRATLPSDKGGWTEIQTDHIAIKDANGRELGAVGFIAWNDEIFIDSIAVTKIAQRRGLSTYLLAEVLARHPQTQRYVAVLAKTNDAKLNESIKQGHSPSEAYRSTPLYRSMQKFGFNHVTTIKNFQAGSDWSAYGVVVDRAP